MKIENSQVELYSKSETTLKHSQTITEQRYYAGGNNTDAVEVENIQNSNFLMIQGSRAVYDNEDDLSLEDKVKKMLIEILLGQFSDNLAETSLYPSHKATNPYQELKAIAYQTTEEYHQKQSIDFSSSVEIQTPDQTYKMDIKISFSKELYESSSSRIVIGDESFIDPLVINYGENVNPFDNISNLHFKFDLDNDGSTEMIPKLKNGAGYLALDKNKNGKIDNGNELFGPKTNNGFKELSQYDTDKNNWIDENDAVFDKLKVWNVDYEGKHSLISLIDSNVGAIYLGEIQSGFKYQSAIDQTDAIQKSNGIFVKEDGSGLGVVNSIDIVA